MTIVYIGVGSNLGDPVAHVSQAISELSQLEKNSLVCASKLYCTKPIGIEEQPDFINSVVKLDLTLSARALLLQLQALENAHGRMRTNVQFGPRTLDLDLLLYGDEVINSSHLTVPHPRMFTRAFVLVPLAEIEPELFFPNGLSVQQCLQNIEETQCQILE